MPLLHGQQSPKSHEGDWKIKRIQSFLSPRVILGFLYEKIARISPGIDRYSDAFLQPSGKSKWLGTSLSQSLRSQEAQ